MSRRSTTEAVQIPKHELTEQQLKAIELLATGKTDQEAAEAVGASRGTVATWRRHDVWFVAELNRRRQSYWMAWADRLRAMLPKALDVLESELSGQHAVAAAIHVFRLAGLEKIGAPTGQADADTEIERMARARRPDLLAQLDDDPPTDYEKAIVVAEIERRLADSDGDGSAPGKECLMI